MRNFLAIAALAAAVSLPLIAGSTAANASCQGRKDTGTILGGIGGALVGNAVAGHGGKPGGTIIGGLGGAVLGHEIAKSGCGGSRHAYYHRSHSRYAYAQRAEPADRKVYYDQYGNAVLSPPTPYSR